MCGGRRRGEEVVGYAEADAGCAAGYDDAFGAGHDYLSGVGFIQ